MPRDSFFIFIFFCFLRFHVKKEHTILPKTTRKYYQLPKDLIFQRLRSCNAATRRDFLLLVSSQETLTTNVGSSQRLLHVTWELNSFPPLTLEKHASYLMRSAHATSPPTMAEITGYRY
jgi:hypothetical protein